MKYMLKISFWCVLIGFLYLLINTVFIGRDDYRSINVMPFDSIRQYIFVQNDVGQMRLVDMNIWGNILMFVTVGIYIATLFSQLRISRQLVFSIAISIWIELMQFIFARGATDIDDVILNMCGAVIGLSVYRICLLLFKTPTKVFNSIAILSLLIGMPVLTLAAVLMLANS